MEQPRIALYFQPIDGGGLFRYVARWLETYADSDISCALVSNNLGLRLTSEHVDTSVRFKALERSSIAAKSRFPPKYAQVLRKGLLFANPIFFLVNLSRQVWLLRELNPSACIAFNGGHTADESCLSLLLAARIRGIPSALVILGTPRKRRWPLCIYELFLDKCLGLARVIVTNARHIAEHPRVSGSAETTRVLTIVNPAPTNKRKPASSRPGKLALEAVIVSRLDSGKGLETAIKAVSNLELSTVSRLSIIGEGLLRDDLERLVEQLDESRRTHFLGHLPEHKKRQTVDSADLIICPSENEGLPFSLLEAMASSLPIVCSSIPGHLELVRHGEQAHTFSPGNAEELEQMIVDIHRDRGLAMKLAKRANEALRAVGSFERFAREIREVDSRLLK